MPFTEEQAPFFFGRDAEREIITANLMAARLTLFYGPSGVGKSSVLNAGVVHHLRQATREAPSTDGTREFVIVTFRTWRDEPLGALERTIEREAGVSGQGKTFADRLQSCADQIQGDVLIILDQFEEYFMYHPGEDGEGTFAAEFARAVNRRDLRASFLLSMREDSIAKLDFFKGRIANLFDNYLRIDRLDRDQAREAIVRPIDQFNRLVAPPDGAFTIEPDLVDAVLDQVKANRVTREDSGRGGLTEHGDYGIETPHLQLVMTRLWQEERAAGSRVLRSQTLRQIGGAGEIVKKHVDAALDALSASERDAAARIFQYLVTPAGTKIALGVEDLYPNAGISASELRALLVRLSSGESRILTPVAPAPDQPARERYQIFHDVLAEKVLGWRTRYVTAAEQRAAEAVAQEERQNAEREARSAARLRRLLAVVAVLLVLSVGAAWWAWRQTERAHAGQLAAEESRLEAERAGEEAQVERYRARENEVQVLAEKARNAILEQERRTFQYTAEAAEARLAGKLAEAEKLRGQAAAAARLAASEEKTLAKLNAEKELAQKERQAAQARAQELETRIREAKPITQVAQSPPPYKNIELPSASPPPPASGSDPPETKSVPAADPPKGALPPSSPTPPAAKPAVTGDYRQSYRLAIDAKNRRRWEEAAQLFQRAAQQNGTDTGERINISGFGNIEPYVPKYYLGLSLKNLNRCPEALQAWEQSERDGAIQKTDLYKALQDNRRECLGQR